MIQFLKRILHLDDQDARLRSFAQTLEASDALRVEIDALAKAYLTNTSALEAWSKEDTDPDVQQLVKGQQESLTGRYLKALAVKRQEFDRLEADKRSYIKKNPDFVKALTALRQRDFVERSLKQYADGQLTLTECDTLIKAATKDKVHYSDNIVFNTDGELLIVQRAPLDSGGANLWVLPGGHVHPDEDHAAGAKRELLEEAGYVAEDVYHVGDFDDELVHIEYYVTMVDEADQSPTLEADETRYSQFVPVKDLYKYPALFISMWDNVYRILGIKNEVVKIKKAVADGVIKESAGEFVNAGIDELFKGCGGGKKEKFHKVMKKWKAGTLHSGEKTGPRVTSQEQAIAIALSETGQSREQKKEEKAVEDELNENQLLANAGLDDYAANIDKGIYVNNEENRKLGRVGQRYGEKKFADLWNYDSFKSAVGDLHAKDDKKMKKLWEDFKNFKLGENDIESERFEIWMRQQTKLDKLSLEDFKDKIKITHKSQGYGKGTDFERTMHFYDVEFEGHDYGTMSSYKLSDAQVAKEAYDKYLAGQGVPRNGDLEKAQSDTLHGASINIPLDKADDKQVLRLAIVAEFDAINLYERMAEQVKSEKVKKTLLDVAKEEKTHVGEFQTLLMALDVEQKTELEAGAQEVEDKSKSRFVRTK